MEDRKMEHLRKTVRETVKADFGFNVTKVDISEDIDSDGDDVLRVDLWLKDGKKRIKKADDYFVIGNVGRAIRKTGEKRYPLIYVHFPIPSKQSA